jgi:DinB superfamily
MTVAIDPAALAILASTPAVLRAMLAPLSEPALAAPLDEGWSVRDALAHVLDVEEVIATDRIGRIIAEDRPFIRSIDPLARMEQRGFRTRTVASLLDELAARRPSDIAALAVLSPEQLARAGDHDEAGAITVGDLIHQWAYHDLMHTKQIASMLQSPLVAGMGNTRKFYDL